MTNRQKQLEKKMTKQETFGKCKYCLYCWACINEGTPRECFALPAAREKQTLCAKAEQRMKEAKDGTESGQEKERSIHTETV